MVVDGQLLVDEEYKKEINADPTIFRMRSSSFEFAVVAIVNAIIDAILVFLKISHHSQSSSLTFSQAV